MIRVRRAGTSPCWRSGNFDGLHRGHTKIIERVRRVAAERGGTVAGPHLRPASAAHRPARQGAAAADDARAEDRSAREGRHPGRRDRAVHPRAVALGARDVRQDACSSTGCAWPRCGWAPTFCSAAIVRATSRCCARSARQYGFRAEKIDPVRYKEFVVSSTRIRRLVAEGRVDEAGALLGHHFFIDGDGRARRRPRPRAGRSDRQPRDQQRADPAARRLCDDGDGRRRGVSERDQYRAASDVRRPSRARSSKRTCWAWTATCTGSACAWASSSACGTSADFRMWTRSRRRLTPTCAAPADCSIDSACRATRRWTPNVPFEFTLTMPGDARLVGAIRELAAQAADLRAACRRRGRRRSRPAGRRPTATTAIAATGDARRADRVPLFRRRRRPSPSPSPGMPLRRRRHRPRRPTTA